MKKIIPILFLLLNLISYSHINEIIKLNENPKLKEKILKGVKAKGSIANEVLQKDTLLEVRTALNSLGVDFNEQESIDRFILDFPKGDQGKRSWKELWIIKIKSNYFFIPITFKENPKLGGVNWSI